MIWLFRIMLVFGFVSCGRNDKTVNQKESNGVTSSKQVKCELFFDSFTNPLLGDSLNLKNILRLGGEIEKKEPYDSKYSSGRDTIFTIRLKQSEFRILRGDKEILTSCDIKNDTFLFGGRLRVGMSRQEFLFLLKDKVDSSFSECDELVLRDEETDSFTKVLIENDKIVSLIYEAYYE